MWKPILFSVLLLIVIRLNFAIDVDKDRRELPTDNFDKEDEVTNTKDLFVNTTESTDDDDALFNEIIDSWKDKYRGFIWDEVTKYLPAVKYEAKKLGVAPLEYLKICESKPFERMNND